MQRKHIHPEELMSPDFLSEIVLVGGILAIVTLSFLLLREAAMIESLSGVLQMPL